MKRRDFIALIGCTFAAWPLAARAQQPVGARRIGVLTTFSESDALAEGWLAAFRKGLEEADWRDGRNVRIDYRRAAGDAERLRTFAQELVALQPDVIFAVTTPTVAALLRETRTAALASEASGQRGDSKMRAPDTRPEPGSSARVVPIVFAQVSDPVGTGFVASLARPGGNVTGFTNINIESSIGGKWLQLLKQIAPSVRRVAMIYNPPTSPFAGYYLRPFEAAGAAFGVEASAAAVDSDADIDNALAALAREPGGGFVVLPDTFTGIHRQQIVALAARYRLPAVYPFRWFAEIGGLLSYGIDSDDMFRRAASYVDRILKGAKPADLPVQAPTKYELLINLKTAKALGLDVPQTLLVTADEVIE